MIFFPHTKINLWGGNEQKTVLTGDFDEVVGCDWGRGGSLVPPHDRGGVAMGQTLYGGTLLVHGVGVLSVLDLRDN